MAGVNGFVGRVLSLSGLVLCLCFGFCHSPTAAAETGTKNGTEERYPLVVFDFERIELPFVICLWILIASLAKIGFHLYQKLPTLVPESCLLIVLGLVAGAILHFSHVATTAEYVLSAHVFFIYLLPPIIFDAGYFMPIRPFFDNVGSVLLLAVVNTLLNTVCIGLSLFAVSYWGWIGRDISLLHCLIFSALISAVDPVAVISVFEEVHVNQMLYIIVFGESLLNDGVTVVLYHMMEGFIELGDNNIKVVDVVTGCGSFFIIALGGTLIGVLYGLFGGFITKYTEHVNVIEPLFVFVLGYLMYLTSEMMHLSGILALAFGGIVLRHYMEHNLSKRTATTIKYFMKMLANISETIIFMFLGLSTIVDTLDWNFAFIFFALVFCLVYRLLGVTILAWVLNRRRVVRLTKIDQFIMAYGGLRGGIAFCLALSLKEELVPEKQLFVTATIIIVFFTVFVQGISMKPVVNALKVKRHLAEESTLNEKIHETMLDHLMAGIESITLRRSHNLMRTKFRRFNHKYMQRILGRGKPKAKATKLVKLHHELTEQDAIKSASAVKLTANGSTIDLYEDHRRALIQGTSGLSYRSRSLGDTHAFEHALQASRPGNWRMDRQHTLADSPDTVTYHRQLASKYTRSPAKQNGDVSMHIGPVVEENEDDDFEAVTINIGSSSSSRSKDNNSADKAPIPESTAPDTVPPWRDSSGDQTPTQLSNSYQNNDPVVAHVPSWVNNLSYSHITETGSPYVSPQTTLIPQHNEHHQTVYSLFMNQKERKNSGPLIKTTNENYFPTPWNHVEPGEECPQVSPMVTESAKKCDLLESAHMAPPPEHHHVIEPINHHSVEKVDSRVHHTLSAVASAPNFQHWHPIKKIHGPPRLPSDTMLTEIAHQEDTKHRVQDWLNFEDEDNDADNDDEQEPQLNTADELERELDIKMGFTS